MLGVKRPGVSLIEVILATAVFSLVIPLLFVSFNLSFKLTGRAQEINIASNVAAKTIETLRQSGFDSIALNSNPTAVAVSELPEGWSKTYVENYQGNDKIKQITVKVYWTGRAESQAITLITLIGQGGING